MRMQPTLAIILPCLNEEGALPLLLKELEDVLAQVKEQCLIVVVDDGSTDATPQRAMAYRPKAGNMAIEVLALPYTMGHQEAIYQGLLFASGTTTQRFVVMDGDGEDDPAAIHGMLEKDGASIVFVARGKRSESAGFRLGYALYLLMFRMVAGRSIRYGNYSMIDRRVLGAALDHSFVHYAAFLSKQRVRTGTVKSDRRPRLEGASKMGFDDLGMHAFKSLIEYSDRLLAMLLKAFLYLSVVFMLSALTIVGIKLFTDLAIPGWASNLSATLFNSLLLCLGFFTMGLMLARTTRQRERAGRHLYTRIDRQA